MKNFRFIQVILLFFVLEGFVSCDLWETEDNAPGVSIYKTKGDYFDLVTIGMKDNEIFRTSSFTIEGSKFTFSDNDTIYKYRIKLRNGYVLSGESDSRYDVFLKLSFKDQMKLEKRIGPTIPFDTLKKYILDSEPYTEFYRDNSRKFSDRFECVDTAEINNIIKEGEIEKYFTKLK